MIKNKGNEDMKTLIQVYPWLALTRPDVSGVSPYRVEVEDALKKIYDEMDRRLSAIEMQSVPQMKTAGAPRQEGIQHMPDVVTPNSCNLGDDCVAC